MTSRRRDHGDDHGLGTHRAESERTAREVDPWEALGARSGDDDFWGDIPDWSGTASTSRRSGRSRIGAPTDDVVDPTPIGSHRPRTDRTGRIDLSGRPDARPGFVGSIRNAWDGLVGGGVDATREHRRLDVGASASIDGETPADDAVDHASPFPYDVASDDPPRWAAMTSSGDAADERIHLELDRDEYVDGAAAPDAPSPVDGLERRWLAEAATSAQAERRPIDPLLMRLGAVVIVACLLVPMFVAVLRSGDSIEATAGAIASESSPTAVETVPGELGADTPASDPSNAPVLDPESLPPAVPVNTEPAGDTDPDSEPDLVSADAPAASTESVGSVDAPTAVSAELSPGEGDTRDASDASLTDVDAPALADDPAARIDPPVCPVPYTVVTGDYWLRLVEAADVTLADLLAVNGATVDTRLLVGAEICLPEGATTPAPPTTAAPTTTPPTTVPPTTVAPTTTTPPTTTTTTTTVAPSTTEPPGPEEIKQIIRDVWPDDLEDRALEVVFKESRFVPTAKNFCCYGLFQIYWEVHDVWLVDLGITSASQLYDPETNARAALALYERAGGWGPWNF